MTIRRGEPNKNPGPFLAARLRTLFHKEGRIAPSGSEKRRPRHTRFDGFLVLRAQKDRCGNGLCHRARNQAFGFLVQGHGFLLCTHEAPSDHGFLFRSSQILSMIALCRWIKLSRTVPSMRAIIWSRSLSFASVRP